jgi:hypothetical protein
VTGRTVVATANVQGTIRRGEARHVLRGILGVEPDLVGLQEWGPSRRRLLREPQEYLWVMPLLGGCVVGARADRFDLVESAARVLSVPGRADRREGWWGIEPARIAMVGVYRDKRQDRTVCLVSYHLVHGVQGGGRYREDRPVLVARHRSEVRSVQRIVDEHLALGHEVYAVGDSNFDGFRLEGLTSAWVGREHEPGTLGRLRKVDDVLGPGPATSVQLLASASDHKAVVATYAD